VVSALVFLSFALFRYSLICFQVTFYILRKTLILLFYDLFYNFGHRLANCFFFATFFLFFLFFNDNLSFYLLLYCWDHSGNFLIFCPSLEFFFLEWDFTNCFEQICQKSCYVFFRMLQIFLKWNLNDDCVLQFTIFLSPHVDYAINSFFFLLF